LNEFLDTLLTGLFALSRMPFVITVSSIDDSPPSSSSPTSSSSSSVPSSFSGAVGTTEISGTPPLQLTENHSPFNNSFIFLFQGINFG
jgi:hypothetical protein